MSQSILDPGKMLNLLLHFEQINEAFQPDPGDNSSVDKKLIEWCQERIKGYDHSSYCLEDNVIMSDVPVVCSFGLKDSVNYKQLNFSVLC